MARADTVFFYSKPERYYGACYGCSAAEANREAYRYCAEGGSACMPVLWCQGGWAAVAFVTDGGPGGMALTCGYGNAFTAQAVAVAHCMVEANWYCYPDNVTSPDGVTTEVGGSNAFMSLFLTQVLLQLNGYEVPLDGQYGETTRAALAGFLAKLGRPPQPAPNMDETWYMIAGAGGRQYLFDKIREGLVEDQPELDATRVFVHITEPMPDLSFGHELMAMDEAVRRQAVTYYLLANNQPCTMPAEAAFPVFEDDPDSLWQIECAEATVRTMMTTTGARTFMSEPK